MSKYQHLFILDALETLNYKLDSSLRMAFALQSLGQTTYLAETKDLFWRTGACSAQVVARKFHLRSAAIDSHTSIQFDPRSPHLLTCFDAIHMRKDPPFNIDYITATWILESAKRHVRIYNSPSALRSINEKLAIFRFPSLIQIGLVTSNAEMLFEFFIKEAAGDAILKPLTLFGGRGVKRFQSNQDGIREAFRLETDFGRDYRLIQPFDASIYNGEVRAFAVGGKPIAWCLKKPAANSFLANTPAGATLEQYQPTTEEEVIVTQVSRQLLSEGVAIVGFDLIGGRISEINITSPRLLQAECDRSDYYQTFAEWLVHDVHLSKLGQDNDI